MGVRGFHLWNVIVGTATVTDVPSPVPEAAETVAETSIPTLAVLYLLLVLVFIFLLYQRGKKNYTEYCAALDEKEYPVKSLMVIGYALLELIRYPYSTAIDLKVRRQLKELKEEEYIDFYLIATWAMAATYFVFALFLSAILAVADIGVLYVLAVIGMGGLFAMVPFSKLDQSIENRHLLVSLDLPDFANKLLILSGAGLSIKAAIIKISKEMDKDTPFYISLKHSVFLMENGSTAEQALDELAGQCNMPVVRRMTSILIQNMYRGGADVLLVLKDMSNELWNTRKATAKMLAEQAGTKLLFPMMLMLLAVIVVVAMPAVMSLSL